MFFEPLTLLGGSALAVAILARLGLPSIVGYFAVGILLGPHGMAWIPKFDSQNLVNEIAIIFLMFTIGLEFSWRRIISMRRAFFGLGAMQFICTSVCLFLFFLLCLDLPWRQAACYGMIAFVSSTAVLIRLFKENYDTSANSPYGNTTMSVLIFQDLAAIPVMMLIPLLALIKKTDAEVTWLSFAQLLGFFVVITISAFFCLRFVLPVMLRWIGEIKSKEVFLFFVASLCFIAAEIAHKVGLSYGLGAFVLGVALATSPFHHRAASEILTLRDICLSILFLSLGLQIDVGVLAQNIGVFALVLVAVAFIKILVTYASGIALKYPHSVSLVTAIMLFQVGEFAFVFADTARVHKIMPYEHLQMLMLGSLISMALTPYVFRKIPAILKMTKQPIASREDAVAQKDRKRAIIVGYGIAGRKLRETLTAWEIPVSVIDLNMKQIEGLQKDGIRAIMGDASEEHILHQAGIDEAQLVIICVSGRMMTQSVLNTLTRLKLNCKVLARFQYQQELAEIKFHANLHAVVAEEEVSETLVVRALEIYGAPVST